MLQSNPRAVLVDVRTRAEWTFVGIPDLQPVQHKPVLLEWQTYPAMAVNGAFVDQLASELKARGLDESVPVLFLCRSGVRSQAAAMAAVAAGFTETYNIAGGFEGPLSSGGHRGEVGGWKASGLPWIQN